MTPHRLCRVAMALTLLLPSTGRAQAAKRRPLSATDIGDITTLVMLEDNRRLDAATLERILKSAHPEVRRRAAQSIGRIANPDGRAILVAARGDIDTAVAATVVFAAAQLYDTAAVPWLDSLLGRANTPLTVATEAARAMGMIRTPESREALVRYLSSTTLGARNAPIVGEALLSMGREARGDLAPLIKWSASPNVEVRWRATWALFRPRDPASVPRLLELTHDREAVVRNWAARGLGWPEVDSSGVDAAAIRARLRALVADPDRTVRTEALRSLATHPDSASVAVTLAALASDDSWISVSAAEGLASHRDLATTIAPKLADAATRTGACARRSVALTSLNTLDPEQGFAPAHVMARDTAVLCRTAAVTFFRTKRERGREPLAALMNDADSTVRVVAKAAFDFLSDTTQGRGSRGRGGRGGGGRGRPPIETGKTEADYRRIVEQWIVPDYNGTPRPRTEWTTPRGTFEIELYPGDAPIATDYLVSQVKSGAIVGTDFSRVVPDFVDQQRPIAGAMLLRDEVNRHRLSRGNLAWATAGLDTGRPGYTLGHTAMPHNEGSFTSLGRVVRGMDVVDRIELGDGVTATRMVMPRQGGPLY